MSAPIGVLVVDDHIVVRAGIRTLLASEPTVEVIGEASNGVEAVAQAASLQPDVDGLIIEAEGRRALFLPSVWEKLREPKEFLGRLKQKAGLAPDYWSPNLRAWRYRTESFGGGKAAG